MTNEEDEAITLRLFSGEPQRAAKASQNASIPQPGVTRRSRSDTTPPVLTVDELAALLRVNRKTVYAALSRGEIPSAKRIGATYRIHREAVLEWLASSQDRAARSRSQR
jgi:excisionase family DNA binding protein